MLSLIFLSFSVGRIAQLVEYSLQKREVSGSSPVHGTLEFFFLLVYDDILLACAFYNSFPSLNLFLSN